MRDAHQTFQPFSERYDLCGLCMVVMADDLMEIEDLPVKVPSLNLTRLEDNEMCG